MLCVSRHSFGDHMNPQETFVTRLRRRMRARVSIEQIADSLRIKPEIIAAFEANDLSEWPGPLFARVDSRLRARRRSRSRRRWTSSAVCFRRAIAGRRHDPGDRGDRRVSSSTRRIRPSRTACFDAKPAPAQKPAWHAFVTQPGRALWTRLTGPEFRARRAPRTP